MGADPEKRNNFDFSKSTDQTRCPFSAHIRKTNPRSDLLPAEVARSLVMRHGIPFGPEVSPQEATSGKTAPGISRGLGFVCYQSKISNGFSFLQKAWANNQNFPPKRDPNNPHKNLTIGFDPIIGTNGGDLTGRVTIGTDPNAQEAPLRLPIEWVVPRGGAYFFAPPISALTSKLAA